MSSAALLHSLRDPRIDASVQDAEIEESSHGQEEVVVLVHGTYAAREADQGDSWWQQGSTAWKELQQRLPPGVCAATQGEVFHWSGENSERSRIKAAHDLLAHLSQLEAAGRRFHLIGHSHGGSVIWHALRLATIRRKELKNLQSWTTVGTPFLHHRTRGAWNVVNLLNLLLAVILFRPAMKTLYGLLSVIVGPYFGIENALYLKPSEIPETISFLQTPVLRVVELMGLSTVDGDGGIRIGSFNPAEDGSIYSFLFLTSEGWFILALAAIVIYVYLNLAGFFLGSFLESQRIRSEKRLDEAVRTKFQHRWLGLWSPDDEAINGLRATLGLSTSFVGRMVPRERVLFSDHLSLLSRPYYWILAPLFNRFARPAMDSVVRKYVIKTAQGNNRPASEVVEVSPTPWLGEQSKRYVPLPDWLNERLVASANEHARTVAPKLRQMLAEPPSAGGPEAFGAMLSGEELVHTAYFDHPEILDLLAMQIASPSSDQLPLSLSENGRLASWFHEFRSQIVAADSDLHESGKTRTSRPAFRTKPRRRAGSPATQAP